MTATKINLEKVVGGQSPNRHTLKLEKNLLSLNRTQSASSQSK